MADLDLEASGDKDNRLKIIDKFTASGIISQEEGRIFRAALGDKVAAILVNGQMIADDVARVNSNKFRTKLFEDALEKIGHSEMTLIGRLMLDDALPNFSLQGKARIRIDNLMSLGLRKNDIDGLCINYPNIISVHERGPNGEDIPNLRVSVAHVYSTGGILADPFIASLGGLVDSIKEGFNIDVCSDLDMMLSYIANQQYLSK